MDKRNARLRRARRARARIRELGATRLCVNRTPQHTYAQIISGDGGAVLASASTVEKGLRAAAGHGGNIAAAAEVGKRIAERALSVGVTLISENVDHPPSRPLMGRAADCRDICAQVDSPGFRLIYDCAASLFVGEDSLETLHAMAPHVAHVHIKNSRPLAPAEQRERFLEADSGQRYTGTDIDGGVIELPPILAELDQLGYDGYMLLEYQGEEDPRVALPRNIAHLRQLLA